MKTELVSGAIDRWQASSGTFRAYVILLFGVVAFGFSGVFAHIAHAPGLVVAAWRVGIASAVLAIPAMRQRQAFRGKGMRWAVLGGCIFAVSVSGYHLALDHTSAANATFIGNLAPLWVGLLTLYVLRRKLPQLFWPGVTVAMGGAAVMILGSANEVGLQPGDLLAIFNSLIWALYQVVSGRVRDSMSTIPYVWLTVTIAAFGAASLALLSGYALTGYDATTAVAFLGAGLISQAGGFVAFNYALGHLPPARVAATNLLQPVVTAVAALILLAEPFGGWRLVGGALILVGVYLVNRSRAAEGE